LILSFGCLFFKGIRYACICSTQNNMDWILIDINVI
jgi:hypothetical protein